MTIRCSASCAVFGDRCGDGRECDGTLLAVMRNVLGGLALPPILILLAALAGAALAWRGHRAGAAIALVGIAATLLLATPMVSGLLLASLEGGCPPVLAATPGAIIILGAEASNARTGRRSVP